MLAPLYQIDAFSDKVFGGNPAAVCPLEHWPDDELLQAIAAENNLSETAFLVKKGEDFELRWFTPTIEVDLCGHATLASAFVVFNHLDYQDRQVRFHTRSGALSVRQTGDLLAMDFPARKPSPVEPPELLVKALKSRPREVHKSRDYLALFDDEDAILAIAPDFKLLMKLDCLGIIVTAKGKESDFVSRFFAPAAGVPEDPVTGSAHCTLIPFWAERLGKKTLLAVQVSNRGGTLHCEDRGERVSIAGKAVMYSAGFIQV
jgi:PhzF family phenazine biosynthesis protein